MSDNNTKPLPEKFLNSWKQLYPHTPRNFFQKRCMQCNFIMTEDLECNKCGNGWYLYPSQVQKIIMEGYLGKKYSFPKWEAFYEFIDLSRSDPKDMDDIKEHVEAFWGYRNVFGSKEFRSNRRGITEQFMAMDNGFL